MTKGTSATRRGLGHAATRAASIIRFGLQREAAKGASSPRHMPDAAAKVEQLLTRVSAIPPHESSPVRPYRPKVQNGHNSSYVGRYRCRRSCRALHGPKRPHGERRVRSYGSRRGNHIGDRNIRSYGSRRGNHTGDRNIRSYGSRRGNHIGDRNVRSYGSRRVYSYGERHVSSYGYSQRRLRLYGRERQHVVQHGHNGSGNRFRRLFRPSYIELLSSSAGALWVAGQFLNAFRRNLDFSNLPAILKVKYQLAGNEHKSLSQAQAVWKSIPAQVRAGGPEALWKFHQGKEWSHIIPRSWGGSSTADNAIWWASEKNRSLGPIPMSLAGIADAKAVMRSDAVRAAVAQTASGMVKGTLVAGVVGSTLACLECGLDYAEGKITGREMAQIVVRSGVTEGGGAFVTTGIIVGISLLFPFLIPILTPALIVLQAASLALMGAKGVRLAKGWWAVVERQQFLDHSAFGEAVKAFPKMVKTLPAMTRRNIYPSVRSLIGTAQGLSIGKTVQSFPWKANRGTRDTGLTGLPRQVNDNTRI